MEIIPLSLFHIPAILIPANRQAPEKFPYGWVEAVQFNQVLAAASRCKNFYSLAEKSRNNMNKSTTVEITPKEYAERFAGKEEKALNQALDIRKFEIELYWKRATYFWTFIGATMAGFLAIQASTVQNKQDLSVILACLGIVFSFAWFCVNRGSKHWQENWEKHVDALEDAVTGPLYKVVLSRNNDMTKLEKIQNFITGPSAISVSKTKPDNKPLCGDSLGNPALLFVARIQPKCTV